MGHAATNTVEIHAVPGRSVALQRRLQALLAILQSRSGCALYSLRRSAEDEHVWILQGYWHSSADMWRHFEMQCLAQLFEMTTDRLASALLFETCALLQAQK
jgi:quinol monooxygenase YgiN